MAARKPPMEQSTADPYAMEQPGQPGRPPMGGGVQRKQKPGQQPPPMTPPLPMPPMMPAQLPKVPDMALTQPAQPEPYGGMMGGMKSGMPDIMQLLQMILGGKNG